jgi:hypothetical protein
VGRGSGLDLEVGDDDHGAQGGDEVQDSDLVDVVDVLAQLGPVSLPGIGWPISGSTETTNQGAVEGVELCFAREGLQLFSFPDGNARLAMLTLAYVLESEGVRLDQVDLADHALCGRRRGRGRPG